MELIIILVVALVIFGPKRLPELGNSLGRGMREFKDSVSGKSTNMEPQELRASADEAERVEGEVVREHRS